MANEVATVLPRMHRKGPFTVEVPGEPVEGETLPRRNAKSPDKLVTYYREGVNTLFEIIKDSAQRFGDSKALGARKLIKKHYETKKIKKIINGREQEVEKTWTYFEMSGYNYITYKEFETITHQIGAGLRKLGLSSPDRVHLFAATSAHWMPIAHGAISQSMSIVTAYDTLGEEGLRHSLVATKAKAIFLEPHLLKLFLRTLKDATSIKLIIYNTDSEEELKQEDVKALKDSFPHVQLISYEELRALGEQNPVPVVPPTPDDYACIMYTSGTGGTPKGVELRHRHVVAAAAGGINVVADLVSQKTDYLAYLPLAHIFEFVFEHAVFQWGAPLGYGSVRTLSAASVRNCKGDIQEFKPVLLVGIPAVWETVKKGILANLAKASKPVQTLFWSAYAAKRSMLKWGLPGVPLLDSIVFSKVKEATGGKLKFALCGAAPIARDTQEFISFTICPLINGYGLTETVAMGLIGDPLGWTLDAHGEPPTSIEIKLLDYPEAGYLSKNKPNPQGEILIRGPAIFEDYFGLPELTEASFAPGKWFKTGDIGQWEKNGQLKIIDRKKNLVKNLNGEYLALEKLEAVYRSATIVGNICIYASINEVKPIAIIVPVEAPLKQLAASLGVEGHGIEDLSHSQVIIDEVLKQLLAVAKKAGLANIELIQGVVLSDEEWTPQNNLVTATNKLNRNFIVEKFQKNIDAAYGKA